MPLMYYYKTTELATPNDKWLSFPTVSNLIGCQESRILFVGMTPYKKRLEKEFSKHGLSFWSTFASLSINSAKNLAKTLNYLSGRSFTYLSRKSTIPWQTALSSASWLMTILFFKHLWKCGIDYH